ncbi:hypothetical protein B0H66DRAFT_603666 [Apodospora peruviana]|uniref:Heterokaryon incompatibility domain-containing protein n=1 Tax=Apodospora peruviana TaxID=516989 RepID=A0AAE0M4J5_9PEZI|nr:hypothetical protein B0H66DRAFT_603666 [Apodospora peruviana]
MKLKAPVLGQYGTFATSERASTFPRYKSKSSYFYNDPRDNIPSDLGDQEDDFVVAVHCCDKCQLMTGTDEGLCALVRPEGCQHFTCDQVRLEAKISGCAFCELIRRMIAQCVTCGKSASGDGVIRVWGMSEDSANDNTPVPSMSGPELGVLALQESPVARHVVGRRPDKTLTPELILQFRTWLNDCQDGGHKSCPRRWSPRLPTRVVDIGENSHSQMWLHMNNGGFEEGEQYAGLSYCRGGDQPYKTTTAKLAAYTRQLVPDRIAQNVCRYRQGLPRFGDALHLDNALCTVQDDNADKGCEINQMVHICKDATVTIMAGSASSVYAGFLDDAKGAVFVRNSFNSRPYFLDEEPIFKRAWTLQETLLSSRIIVFDSYQVTLKCGEKEYAPALPTLKRFHLGTLAAAGLEDEGDHAGDSMFSTQC